MLVIFICVAVVVVSDVVGVFNQQVVDNLFILEFTYMWDAYRDFTDVYPVDVVTFGNSHGRRTVQSCRTSLLLNANFFSLCFNISSMPDVYYTMQECFRIKKPKIAILETYCMYQYDFYEANLILAANQQNFNLRSNTWEKILSTPDLFTSDNYLGAWSNTIRNHNFILTDLGQIKRNIGGENEYIKYSATHNDYFLGQDINGFRRLTDSMLNNLDTIKWTTDASKIIIYDEAKEYLEKIVNLCKENDVKLIIMTAPVHYKILRNWDKFRPQLEKEFAKYDLPWLDFQTNYDTTKYIPMVFSNEFDIREHLIWYGQIILSQQVAEYLKSNFSDYLPKRDTTEQLKWLHNCPDFFGFSEYIYWYSVVDGDRFNRAFLKNTKVGDYLVNEVDYAISNRGNTHKLVLKVEGNKDVTQKKVMALVSANYQGQKINAWVEFAYHQEYFASKHYVFQCDLNLDIQIENILAVQIN